MRAAAWATVGCVTPSALWRSAVGLGVNLGWSDEQLAEQDIPGTGTAYVLGISATTLVLAALTLRLTRPHGDRVPRWVPVVGGRRMPVPLVAAIACTGALVIAYAGVAAVQNWSSVSGFDDRPRSAAAMFMVACYAPALLWSPLLLAVTIAYVRYSRNDEPQRSETNNRRERGSEPARSHHADAPSLH